jgi:hypothetical protein
MAKDLTHKSALPPPPLLLQLQPYHLQIPLSLHLQN